MTRLRSRAFAPFVAVLVVLGTLGAGLSGAAVADRASNDRRQMAGTYGWRRRGRRKKERAGGGSGGRFHATTRVGDGAPAAEAKGNLLGSAVDVAGDADEGAIALAPVLLTLAAIIGIAASVSVVWQAPVLLAEVLVDATIAALVYQRVKTRPALHWTSSVWRRTWKPALAITTALTVFGAVIPWLAPDADSIGDLFRNAGNPQPQHREHR